MKVINQRFKHFIIAIFWSTMISCISNTNHSIEKVDLLEYTLIKNLFPESNITKQDNGKFKVIGKTRSTHDVLEGTPLDTKIVWIKVSPRRLHPHKPLLFALIHYRFEGGNVCCGDKLRTIVCIFEFQKNAISIRAEEDYEGHWGDFSVEFVDVNYDHQDEILIHYTSGIGHPWLTWENELFLWDGTRLIKIWSGCTFVDPESSFGQEPQKFIAVVTFEENNGGSYKIIKLKKFIEQQGEEHFKPPQEVIEIYRFNGKEYIISEVK